MIGKLLIIALFVCFASAVYALGFNGFVNGGFKNPSGGSSFLLLENSSYLLLEDGTKLILE